MKELVGLADPSLTRNSLILAGATLRTLAAILSACFLPFAVQKARPTISPLKEAGAEVTLNVALTLAPGAIGPGKLVLPAAAVQPAGKDRLKVTPVAGTAEALVNVTTVSCEAPGAKVCRPVG